MNTCTLVLALGFAALTAGEPSSAPGAGIRYAEAVAIGNGTARTYVIYDAAGAPTSIGLELTESALSGLPSRHTSMDIPLPADAALKPYTHMRLDWQPVGHVPEHIYMVPHFDVHFFFMDAAAVAAIPGGPDPIVPDARFVPPDYIAPGNMAEPAMGVHWADRTSGEFNGKPFEKTFIYGFTRGELIFLEPMITKAYLETRPYFTMPVKQPSEVQRSGLYPKWHRIRYDAQSRAFRISLDELTHRDASPR